MGRTTVYRDLHTPTCPERTGRSDRGQSLLNPYKDDLVQRWNAGCRDTRQLCAELRQRGYRGSYPTVARYTQRLRQAQGAAPRQRLMSKRWLAVSQPRPPPLAARRAAWLVLRREDQRTAVESQQLTQLRAHPGELGMPSPSRKTLPSSSASAKGRSLMPGWSAPRRYRWGCFGALPKGCGTTMRRSKPG